MKKDRKSVDDRHKKILQLIQENGDIKVEDIAKTFDISLMTVRRDLQYLESQHLVQRFHGGASLNTQKNLERSNPVQMYKDKISEYAARFIDDNDAIFINGSRTALNTLKYVHSKNVTVYTNNGWAVNEEYPEGVSLHLTGGELRGHIMIGDYVMRNLLEMKADKTFLGCAAVYDNGEFRYDITTEIGINESMIACTTKELYILADHTKIVNRASHENRYGSCTYERHWTLITDEKANPEAIERLRSTGMRVIVIGDAD